MFFVWLVLFAVALSDGCAEKPKKEGVGPTEEVNEDEDVIAERERVQKVLELQDAK